MEIKERVLAWADDNQMLALGVVLATGLQYMLLAALASVAWKVTVFPSGALQDWPKAWWWAAAFLLLINVSATVLLHRKLAASVAKEHRDAIDEIQQHRKDQLAAKDAVLVSEQAESERRGEEIGKRQDLADRMADKHRLAKEAGNAAKAQLRTTEAELAKQRLALADAEGRATSSEEAVAQAVEALATSQDEIQRLRQLVVEAQEDAATKGQVAESPDAEPLDILVRNYRGIVDGDPE